MIRTFNCGVGFCIIVPEKNVLKIKKCFQKILRLMKLGIFQKVKEE